MNSVRPAASSSPIPIYDTLLRSKPPSSPIPQPGLAPDHIERERPTSSLLRGAKVTYDLLLGEDLDRVVGKHESIGERGLGALSLGSNVFPMGKALGIATKALAHLGVALGGNALAHLGAFGATDLGRAAIRTAEHESVAISIVRDVGGKYPSLDLKAIEKGVRGHPHTIREHVGKTIDDLKARLRKNSHIPSSSLYHDLATAQRSVDFVVAKAENQARIADWLKDGSKRTLTLRAHVPAESIGTTISRADAAASRDAVATNDAIVVFSRDSQSPTAYTILTSYPETI